MGKFGKRMTKFAKSPKGRRCWTRRSARPRTRRRGRSLRRSSVARSSRRDPLGGNGEPDGPALLNGGERRTAALRSSGSGDGPGGRTRGESEDDQTHLGVRVVSVVASTSTVTTPTATVGSPARLADDTAQGKTTISASVVQKIAGIAAREISGVYAMGGGVSRAFGAFRERIPGGGTGVSNIAGVQVEVGEKQAAVDLDIVVEYGASIVDLARAVRRNVITAVERMTGLEVIEVNIAVNDIQIPGAEDGTDAPVAPPHARVE